MKQVALAFIAGLVFALGLGVSGMTNPEKVIGFLDVAGHWDPSLAFVMVGAIGVHVLAVQWAGRGAGPLWSDGFAFPPRGKIDGRFVAGAALFGVGWGVAGYCPGPAIVDLGSPSRSLVTFVVAMVAGTVVFRLWRLLVAAGRAPSREREPGTEYR